jgi:hypothetical protein
MLEAPPMWHGALVTLVVRRPGYPCGAAPWSPSWRDALAAYAHTARPHDRSPQNSCMRVCTPPPAVLDGSAGRCEATAHPRRDEKPLGRRCGVTVVRCAS